MGALLTGHDQVVGTRLPLHANHIARSTPQRSEIGIAGGHHFGLTGEAIRGGLDGTVPLRVA